MKFSQFFALIFSCFIFLLLPEKVLAATYYVSKTGNNSNGLSWANAWSELNQINWSAVQPGDTIFIDGGSVSCSYPTYVTNSSNTPKSSSGGDCGMVYESTLTIGKSGTSDRPVTIKLSDESGRNGTVRIFGGRFTPLPYCGQSGYSPQISSSGVRSWGIYLSGVANVIIDGSKWSGIKIYGHNTHGIKLDGHNDQNYITFRNIEVFDNGNYGPNSEGIYVRGIGLTFDRVIVHDNGQDAFQTGASISGFKLIRSWLFNQRPHPNGSGNPWNSCTHSDGIQIWGSTTKGLTVEDSIIGPGFMQGLILGEPSGRGNVNGVTMKNSLLVGFHGPDNNANMITKADSPANYTLDRVTSVKDSGMPNHNIYIQGTGHTVTNSIFYGGVRLTVSGTNSETSTNNYKYLVQDNSLGAVNVDPNFLDPNYAGVGNGFADFDFTIQNSAIPAGVGTTITSVAKLLGGSVPPPSSPPSSPSPLPSPSPVISSPSPSPVSLPLSSWIEAESGNISSPFTATSGYVAQNTETTTPLSGGKATYTFNIPQTGGYLLRAMVKATSLGSNSFFVNFDTEPSSPTMIWDINPLTSGFAERTISHRGSGTPEANEFNPKIFNLTAGTHTLIVRGREADTQLDKIMLIPQLLQADLNQDGKVDSQDMNQVLTSWNSTTANLPQDINQDGKVNAIDAVMIVANWH